VKAGAKKLEEPTCPLWMMTFGDCMSLLVTFFVMLIAFSNIEEHKLLDMLGALKGGLRAVPSAEFGAGRKGQGKDFALTYGTSRNPVPVSSKELSVVSPYKEALVRRLARHELAAGEEQIVLELLAEGFALIVYASAAFEDGTAQFTPAARNIWRAFADMAFELQHEVRIVGVVPGETIVLSQRFGSPWGLAAERAAEVKNYLCEHCGMQPERFSLGADASAFRARREDIPADRMELVIVGYYPSIEQTASEVILKGM